MIQITITEEKKMTVAARREAMPYELLADGEVVGVVKERDFSEVEQKVKTKCPNCGLTYDAIKPDNKPPFFSIRHNKS